jgi:TM2 domain-containing membrane protein YozV
MKSENVAILLGNLQSKVPAEKLPILKQRLEAADDDKMSAVQMVQMKDPVIILVLSLFIGTLGVDRFMLGQTGLGVAKLLTCGGMGIWAMVDWFLVMGIAKEDNFQKIMSIL